MPPCFFHQNALSFTECGSIQCKAENRRREALNKDLAKICKTWVESSTTGAQRSVSPEI